MAHTHAKLVIIALLGGFCLFEADELHFTGILLIALLGRWFRCRLRVTAARLWRRAAVSQ